MPPTGIVKLTKIGVIDVRMALGESRILLIYIECNRDERSKNGWAAEGDAE